MVKNISDASLHQINELVKNLETATFSEREEEMPAYLSACAWLVPLKAKHFKSFNLLLVPAIWRNNGLGENKKVEVNMNSLHLFF